MKGRALALLPILFFPASAALAARKRPNVIVVDVCSARADHFSVYGYARDTSPELRRLAGEGVVFDNAVAQSSWCRPNYASLFTGDVPEEHGMYTNLPGPLPPFERPLAERLKEAGYKTAAFSGGVYLIPEFGLSQGFDAYVNLFSTSTAGRVPASVDDTIAPASRWLEKNKGGPFFLYLAVDDMHVPYHSDDPEKYDPGYSGPVHDPGTLSIPFYRAYNGEETGYSPELKARAEDFKKDPRNLKHLIAHYDASLNYTDRRIGDLIRKLKRMGLWKNTVFLVTADHGEMLGEKGLLGHTQGLYEPVLHVPLLLHHPAFGRLAGRRLSQQVQRIDLMPTILDFAGADYDPKDIQGRSILPLLRDPSAPWSPYAFAASKRDLAVLKDLMLDERVVRTARWKLHHYLYKDRFELYDLLNDPLETTNVADKHPDVVSELSYQLISRMEETRPHAPGPSREVPQPVSLEPPYGPKN